MEDTNLYDEIVSNFEKIKKIKRQKKIEDYNKTINIFCDNLYSIVFNTKLKPIVNFDNDDEEENIEITDENYLLYRKFMYINHDQKFILVFNSLNLDKIIEIYKDSKDAFISDMMNEFNKRYNKFKIRICSFNIDKETENCRLDDNKSLKPVPNLYRYKIILNYLSCDTK